MGHGGRRATNCHISHRLSVKRAPSGCTEPRSHQLAAAHALHSTRLVKFMKFRHTCLSTARLMEVSLGPPSHLTRRSMIATDEHDRAVRRDRGGTHSTAPANTSLAAEHARIRTTYIVLVPKQQSAGVGNKLKYGCPCTCMPMHRPLYTPIHMYISK